MTLPDCAACGSRVVSDIDDTRGQVQVCTGCATSQAARPVFAGIRQAVRESRRRRLLGPSCLGRLHHRCTASGCTCTCHDKTKGAPDAPA